MPEPVSSQAALISTLARSTDLKRKRKKNQRKKKKKKRRRTKKTHALPTISGMTRKKKCYSLSWRMIPPASHPH